MWSPRWQTLPYDRIVSRQRKYLPSTPHIVASIDCCRSGRADSPNQRSFFSGHGGFSSISGHVKIPAGSSLPGKKWSAPTLEQRKPMNKLTSPFNSAPACGAKTRRGSRCLCPAMPNGRCKLHGGRTPSGPHSVHFIHGHRSKAAEQTSRDLTQVGRWLRLVEKLPAGQPVTPEIAELEIDLRTRFAAHDQRQAEWRRMLESQGR